MCQKRKGDMKKNEKIWKKTRKKWYKKRKKWRKNEPDLWPIEGHFQDFLFFTFKTVWLIRHFF